MGHSFRTATVRAREKIGSPNRKSLCVNVAQTLSSANPVLMPIFSRTLREPVLEVFSETLKRPVAAAFSSIFITLVAAR
jgi:hypothetical protein